MAKPFITCKVKFSAGGKDFKKKFGLEPGGRVQKTIDRAVLKYSEQYEPRKEGIMHENAVSATVFGSGEIFYPGPYAHYQYMGEVYGPNIPIFDDDTGVPTRFVSPKNQKKHPTGRKLQYSTDPNPNATSYWFEAMKKEHTEDILAEAKAAAAKKGG